MSPVLQSGNLSSFTITFNLQDFSFSTSAESGKHDIQTISLHELGHAIGIAHCHEIGASSCFSTTCTSNVMKPTSSTNTTRRSLQPYDSASKQSIYN